MSWLGPRSRNAAKSTVVRRICSRPDNPQNRIRSGFIALQRLQNKTIHVFEGMPESGLGLSKRFTLSKAFTIFVRHPHL